MQNNFGLKDLILIALILGLFVSVWVSIYQDDRRWDQTQLANNRLGDLEKQIVNLEDNINKRPVVVPQTPAALSAGSANDGRATQAGPMDTSWAREGVEVTVSEPWTFTSNPRNDPDMVAGGEFVEIYEGQPPKLTPYTFSDVYGRRVADMVTESLGWYDPESLELRGRLAQAWQYDPNGMWLRVKIRDEARFSDGSPVLAEDVRFTFHEVIFNQQIEAERYRSIYDAIDKIEVVGDPQTSRVAEFTFKQAGFDNVDKALGFWILPKATYASWIESPSRFNQSTALTMGSGPFRFERVDPDNQWSPPDDIVLVRNEQYWGPRPVLDSYRIRVIADGTSRLVSYTSGGGDMMRSNSQQFIEKRADQSFVEKHDTRMWFNMRGGYSFIAWQTGPRNGQKLTPFHDMRVRKAMTLLLDRPRIRRDISKNLVRAATGPFLSSTPQANPEIEPWPYDPDAGLALLAEAGWQDRDGDGLLEDEGGNPFTFEFTFSNGSESTQQMADFMQASLARHGIKMEQRVVDWSVMVESLNRRDFDAITFAWSASAPESDPYQIWHSDSIENQGDNFIQWSSSEADRLIELGRRTLDYDERMKVWHQLHSVYHEEQPYTFLNELPWMRFTTKTSGNIQEYPSGLEYLEFWVGRESVPSKN